MNDALPDAVAMAEAVARGDVTATGLLDAAIRRAEAADARFNILAQRCFDRARSRAEAFDAAAPSARPSGPLAGVPFLVKDLHVHIAGVPTGEGSRYLAFTPDFDSELVRRADAAGLMIFAKTTTPELGLTATTESAAHGPTRNPWNPARTPGGSSGGAAAAVAAGVVPLAQASDGGGSVRTPASCCGLFGIKTSRGLVPLGPARTSGWNGLSIVGPISRSVRDSAAFLDVLGGPEPGARARPAIPAEGFLAALQRPPAALRIAYCPEPVSGQPVDPEVRRVADDAARLLESLGHHVEPARLPVTPEMMGEAMIVNLGICTRADIAEGEARRGRPPADGELEPVTAAFAALGAGFSGDALQTAIAAFDRAAIAMDRFLARYDAILSPTLAMPPVPLGTIDLAQTDVFAWGAAVTGFGPFTALANWTGLPAVTLPLGTAGGMPCGVMITGPWGGDAMLLALSAAIERAAPWADKRPAP